jgi:hypothetical protein
MRLHKLFADGKSEAEAIDRAGFGKVTVQACRIRVAKIFKNLSFGPGYWLKNLAVYMFEGITSPASPERAVKTATGT